MAPDAGRTAVAPGMVSCLGAGDAVDTATGLEDGFLKGRLGRTRLGENVRFMVAAGQRHKHCVKSNSLLGKISEHEKSNMYSLLAN